MMPYHGARMTAGPRPSFGLTLPQRGALSGGRMLLAVCTGIVGGGASMREGKPWGIVDKERARRMTENIDICRKLWSSEHTGFEGAYISFEQFDVAPKPIQQPCPIWIAANPSPQ